MPKTLPWWRRWFAREEPEDRAAPAAEALASLMAVNREAAAWTDLDQFVQVVVDEALRAAAAEAVSLYLWQEGTARFCQALSHQKGYHWGQVQPAPGQGAIGWVLQHDEPLHLDETQPALAKLVGEDTSVRSLLALPLPAQDGRIIGVLEARNKAGGKPFSGWDLQVLTAIADQAAAALDNNRLYQELYRQGAEMATLFAVSRILAASMEPEETWKAIFEAVRRLMPHEAIEVCLYNEQEQVLRPVLAGTHERFWQPEKDSYHLGEGFTGWIAQTRQYLLLGDIHQETRLRPKYERHAGVDMRAYLGVPMVLGQRFVGTMEIISSTANAFTSHHADLLISVATQAAAAVERMRLFEELSRRLQEARLLFHVSQGIVGTLGLEQVLDMIVRACVEAIPAAQKGALHLLDEGGRELRICAAVGYSQEVIDTVRLKVGQGHAGRVVQSGEPIIVDDAGRNLRTLRTGLAEVEDIRSMVCVPLRVRERTIGVISLDNLERPAAFRQEDVESLSAFAGQAGIAIENARLYEQLHLQVDQLRQLAQQVLLSSTEAQVQTRTSAENIAVLEERSRAIGRFVSQVEQFAEQTDLLALNAAIEAARAGEHGLGFAVVAEEVRRLAESSTEAVGEIAALSQQIVDETHKAVQQMDQVRQAVERTTQLAQGKESAAKAVTAQPHPPEERI